MKSIQILVQETKHVESKHVLDVSIFFKKTFVSKRTYGACIAVVYRLDCSYVLAKFLSDK